MDNDNLISLTSRYFKTKGYTVEYNVKFEGFSGLIHTFDLLIQKEEEKHPIFVMDWRRTVGVNMIIKANIATEDVDLAHPIIVARRFSDHAKAFSNKKKIILITDRELS